MTEPDPTEVIANLLRGPESKRAMDELGIDSSETSRFLSGQRGFRFEQIKAMLQLAGLELISTQRLSALTVMASVGVSYECGRIAGR